MSGPIDIPEARRLGDLLAVGSRPVQHLIVSAVTHQILPAGRPVDVRHEARVSGTAAHAGELLPSLRHAVHVDEVIARAQCNVVAIWNDA